MKLTCVTAVFNAIKAGNRERLIRCVESIAKLKTEHEHLIYDGASTDGTVELLRELEAKTPGLKVVSEPDTGIYNALNKGVRDAKGEWFYVLGCDDYICEPKEMDRQIAVNGCFDMIHAPVLREDGRLWLGSSSGVRNMFLGNCFPHQGTLVRTEVMRRFNGFDEKNKVSADYNFFFNVHKAGLRITYEAKYYALYGVAGFSSDFSRCEHYDYMVLGSHLKLTQSQYDKRRTRSLPVAKLVLYLNHQDMAIRVAARYMLKKRMKWCLFGFIAYSDATSCLRKLYRYLRGHGEFASRG